MPTGYIVSQYNQIETEGDNISDSTLGAPSLQRSPDPDPNNAPAYGEWTVAAANFRISENGIAGSNAVASNGNIIYIFSQGDPGVILPPEVLSVRMQDVVPNGGGQIGNIVGVNVILDPAWTMPASDYTIQVDIDGQAQPILTQDAGNFKVILTNSLMPDPMHYEDSWYMGENGHYINKGVQMGTESSGNWAKIFRTGIMTGTWSDAKHAQYEQYEKVGLQNPSAIANCTITPTNSPVVNGGFSLDGNTWATVCVQWSAASGAMQNQVWDGTNEGAIGGLPLYFEWEITPDFGKTVAAANKSATKNKRKTLSASSE